MAHKVTKSFFKLCKWLIVVLLLVALIAIVAAGYLLGTQSGFQNIPALVNALTPYTLHVDTLEGHFFTQQRWLNIDLQGPGLALTANELVIDFKGSDILDKHLSLQTLSLTDGKIILSDTERPEKESKGFAEALPQIDLPVVIDIEQIYLKNMAIWQGDVKVTDIKEARLSAHFSEQTLDLISDISLTQGDAKLSATVRTQDDYPLTVHGQANVLLGEKDNQSLMLDISQSLLRPNLMLELTGLLNAHISLLGNIDLGQRQLNTELNWTEVDYQQQWQIPSGQLSLAGAFDDLQMRLQTQLNGARLPPIDLHANAQLSDKGVNDVMVVANLLGGKVSFSGDLQYADQLKWNGELAIDDIVMQRYYQNFNGDINGLIRTKGEQTNGQLHADLVIEALNGQWQGAPINGSGKIVSVGQSIDIDNLSLNLAGNIFNANGYIQAQVVDINIDVKANELQHLLPKLKGKLNGHIHLGEQVNDPNIEGKLNWQALSYSDFGVANTTSVNQNVSPLLSASQGHLAVNGILSDLDIDIESKLAGANIPTADISATAKLGTQGVSNIDLQIDTLGGHVLTTGKVDFEPKVGWDIKVLVDKLNASTYLRELDGVLSLTMTSRGSVDDGQISMQTLLHGLSGHWQGLPLSGDAEVVMIDNQLSIEKMNLAIANNTMDLKGNLDPENLNMVFNINGEKLSAIYPALNGRLSGKGKVTGTVNSPNAQLYLEGSDVQFQTYEVASIVANIDSTMSAGGAFENDIELGGIRAGERSWQNIALKSQGSYDSHTIKLNSDGGEVNINLQASGGFTTLDNWTGKLQALALTGYEMDWHMAKPTALTLSPQHISLADFCLVDNHSNVCVNLEKDQQTKLNYHIGNLNPKSFSAFFPEGMRIEPSIKGDGRLVIDANNKINGNLAIQLTPGQLYYQPKNAAPVTLNLTKGDLETQFNSNQGDINLVIDFGKAGSVRGRMQIRDFSQPQVAGAVKIDIPDIGEFQHFVPKVSELKGNVEGELQFSGHLPDPEVTGEILLENGAVKIPEYATDLQDIRLRLSAIQTGQIDIDGNVGTPEGALHTQGKLQLTPVSLDLNLAGQNMLIANSQEARVMISPDINVVIHPETGVNVNGELLIPQARIAIPDFSEGTPISEDVVILGPEGKPKKKVVPLENDSPINVDVNIKLGDAVYFQTPQVKLRLTGGLLVSLLPGQPVKGKGVIEVVSGIYELYGQELYIKRGKITFTGNNIDNPVIDVLALREIDNVKAGAKITGTVQNLKLDLTSEPSLPDSAILSYILFGRAPDGSMDSEALLQTAASMSLGGIFPDNLAEQTGLDVFDLGVTGLKAGKYLGEDMYVGIRSNFFTAVTEFVARYQFNDRLSAEATSKDGDNAIDFLYEFEKD